MELLKKLYCIHSRSGAEKKMKKFIRKYAVERGVKVSYDNKGNMYIVKGEAKTYPCVVAHLDQVQDEHSKDFKVIETEDILFGYSPSKRMQQGLGADDKNGIWIALKCLERFDVLKVAFFVQEEVGCRGSSGADMKFFKDCRFVIEPDRRGYADLITNISCANICSKEFEEDCGADKFGFKAAHGLMTDVLELVEKGVGISCINVSCGYYNPHTDAEITVKKDLLNCLAFVEYAIANCAKVYEHKYEYLGYGGYNLGGYGYGGYSKGQLKSYRDYYGGRGWDDYEDDDDELTYNNYMPKLSDYADTESWLEDVMYCYPDFDATDLWPMISADLDSVGWTYQNFMDFYYKDYNDEQLKFDWEDVK